MAGRYNQYILTDLGAGINRYHSIDQIPEGMMSTLQNLDPLGNGQLVTRAGYERYYGGIPLRANQLSKSGTTYQLRFDSAVAIDLSNIGNGPIVVAGDLPTTSGLLDTGDFRTSFQAHYYDNYSISFRETFTNASYPTADTVTKAATLTGVTQPFMFVGWHQSDSNTDSDNTLLTPDQVIINKSTYSIAMDYVTPSALSGFFTYLETPATAGTVYIDTLSSSSFVENDTFSDGDVNTSTDKITVTGHSYSTGDIVQLSTTGTLPTGLSAATNYYVIDIDSNTIQLATSAGNAAAGTQIDITAASGGGTHSIEIPGKQILSTSHNLNTTNFVFRCYRDTGTTYVEVTPYTAEINSSGDLTVKFNSADSYVVIIYAVATANTKTGITADGSNIEITGITDPFNFFEIWETSAGTRTNVTPGSITYDDSANTVTITYTPSGASDTVEVYWQPAEFIANAIEFEDTGSVSETYSIDDPEITVWGIEQSGIYKSSAPKGGHTHHLDNYKSDTQEHLVTALNGNLLKATSYSSGGTTYLMESLTVRGSNRVSGDQTLAPLFSSSDLSRSRSSVVDASVDADGYAPVTAVSYVSSGVATYTLTFTSDKSSDFTNVAGAITMGNEVSTFDYLTVRNCKYDRNNGTFKIVSGTVSSNVVTFTVSNSACIDATKDESGIVGQGNVFTDQITLTATPVFLVGDTLSTTTTSLDGKTVKTIDPANNGIFISGVTSSVSAPDGINLFVGRTSSVLPLQRSSTETVGSDTAGSGFVRGDSLTITGVTNKPKIKYINTKATTTLSSAIVVASNVATATLANHYLNAGQKICLYASTETTLNGEFTIVATPSSSTFTFATDAADGTYTATMLGKTVEIDESIAYESGPTNVTVTTQGRWTVVESPKSTAAKILETKQQHFDESTPTTQKYIKSVVVNDSMFLVNDDDEVKKYDGTNLVNAGLPPWQGWFYACVDTSGTTFPAGYDVPYSSYDASEKMFVIESPVIKVGQRFRSASTGAIYTAKFVETDSVTETQVRISETPNPGETTTANTLNMPNTYRYYVRLNAVDANRNIVASATLGADDNYVEVFDSSNIYLKIGGVPPFAELDHDRIELEVYRTKANDTTTFYRVYRQLVDFSANGGYVVIKDTRSDSSLGTADLDSVIWNTTQRNSDGIPELGNQWTNPPLANSITTVDNRLVLANIKSPPTIDITFLNQNPDQSFVASDFAGGEVQLQISGTTSGSETHNDSIVFSFENSAFDTFTPTTELYVAENGHNHTWVDGDVTTDTINETNHYLKTGMKVRVSNSGGALPTGLAASTTYYVIYVDANNYKLASSLDNAFAGTQISLTTGGGGTHTTTVYEDHFILDIASANTTGVSAGDWAYLYHNSTPAENNLVDFMGYYRVTEVYSNNGAGALLFNGKHNRDQGTDLGFGKANDVDRVVFSTSSIFDSQERVPVWIGEDGNFNQVYQDDVDVETKATTRLGLAINAVMCNDDPNNSYWTGSRPAPWLLAQSGLSFPVGSLRVIMVDNPSTTLTIQHSGLTNTDVFVNNQLLAASTSANSEIRVFNSRIAASYAKYPEVFDDPYSVSGGDGIIDINPSDGQEITAIIPFFGQSAFGAANLAQSVVAFKSNSIYLVDIPRQQYQKIQSQGQGCTAPRSVTVVQDGVMFANESGIYKLGWDMRISWVGRMVNELWDEDLDLNDITEFAGHNYRQYRQYKLSTVTSGNDYPSNVLVYDHTREAGGKPGSWTEYTNIPATGWANQNTDAFFGSQSGTVFKIRNYGDMSDFRDDESAVAQQQLITGGINYGMPGNRKTTNSITIQYQNPSTLTDVNLLTEQSLSGTFNASTQVDITDSNANVSYSLAERKGTYLRVKMTKSGTKDEQLKLSRMTFHVKDIGTGGVKQAAEVT